jgi:acetyl-CoA carboxylase biotin carboxylase subunit
MFEKVLIANRGEIACRVIRAVRSLGIKAVAIYSEADAGALHKRLADEAIPIGAAPAKSSYLDADRIVQAAVDARCEAVHPGYGFLAENSSFAAMCEQAGLTFIGPRPETIANLGTKTRAREIMAAAGVPVLPGSDDLLEVDDALGAAERVGYPVMLKASGGGGGIGMQAIRSAEAMRKAFPVARERAEAAFRNPALFVERFVERPRHVEVQVLGDRSGNVVHLFERECSIQRRHQKIVEETPAPALDDATRARLLGCAAEGARRASYESAGTLEFLYDPAARDFYFLEVNTRLQVEHTITEATTGIDIVRAQIEIAAGERAPLDQAAVRRSGHAIELRVCAEDPAKGFAPQPGKLGAVAWPSGEGIRCDFGYESGDVVPPYYDSLIAKIIAHGATRAEALERAGAALAATSIEGIRTNVPLLRRIVADPAFARGEYDTGYLTQRKDLLA